MAVSTDVTHSILDKYRQDISVCVINPDSGQSAAINRGINVATGEFVGWLNADDFLYPVAIKAVVGAFALNPGAGVVYGSGAKIDILGSSIYFFQAHQCISEKRKYFQIAGLEEKNHIAVDWELVLKLLDVAEFVSIPDKIDKLLVYIEKNC